MGVSRLADFQLEGLDGVLANLEAWGDRVVAAADSAVVAAASDGADLLRQNAPVDTGRLRGSVEHTHAGWGLALVEAGGPAAPHVRPVESRTAWFNSTMHEIDDSLLNRVADAIIKAAF